jgi:hypothetical protein
MYVFSSSRAEKQRAERITLRLRSRLTAETAKPAETNVLEGDVALELHIATASHAV